VVVAVLEQGVFDEFEFGGGEGLGVHGAYPLNVERREGAA
jgi:hypothetical protein